MLFKIGQDEKYVPGYWKTFPEAYARDAMVYERLLEQSHPQLAKHLRTAGVVPEAYVSKWCVRPQRLISRYPICCAERGRYSFPHALQCILFSGHLILLRALRATQ